MSKSLLEEITQTGESLFSPCIDACVLRRNYYALETSSIKESFDSDVFDFYEDSKYDSIEKPTAKTRRVDKFTINYSFDDDKQCNNSNTYSSSKDQSSELDSFDSVISNFQSFEENPINANTATNTNNKNNNNNNNPLKLRQTKNDEHINYNYCSERLAYNNNNNEHFARGSFNHGRASIASIEEIKKVQNKVKEINDLDYNVNSLIFKAVAVHTDILVMDATVNRLLNETKQLMQELEDVKFLDELIDILNQDIGPVIHKEWKYTKYKCEGPIEQGVMVT